MAFGNRGRSQEETTTEAKDPEISRMKSFNIREVKHDVYDKRQTANGKRQTVVSCVSQKRENLRFSTCLILLRSYSIYLGNIQERSLNKSSFSVFWQKENFILSFAANVMLNLSIISLMKKKNRQHLVKFYRGECLGSPHPGYGPGNWYVTA